MHVLVYIPVSILVIRLCHDTEIVYGVIGLHSIESDIVEWLNMEKRGIVSYIMNDRLGYLGEHDLPTFICFRY
jgi:hypothetical protein